MDVLKQMFSSERRLNQEVARLQRDHGRLKDAFGQFAKHLGECKTDPQFFAEIVKVDLSGLDQQRITLTIFGGPELRLAFDVIRDEAGTRGELVCFYLPASQLAQPEQHRRLIELGRWKFDENGNTDVELSDGTLDITAPKEAVALVNGLVLAAYAVRVAPAASARAAGKGG